MTLEEKKEYMRQYKRVSEHRLRNNYLQNAIYASSASLRKEKQNTSREWAINNKARYNTYHRVYQRLHKHDI